MPVTPTQLLLVGASTEEDEEPSDNEYVAEFKRGQLIEMRIQMCNMVQISSTFDIEQFLNNRQLVPLADELCEFQTSCIQMQTQLEVMLGEFQDNDKELLKQYDEFKNDYDSLHAEFEEIKEWVADAETGIQKKKRCLGRHISDELEAKVEHDALAPLANTDVD